MIGSPSICLAVAALLAVVVVVAVDVRDPSSSAPVLARKPDQLWYRNPTFYNLMMMQVASVLVTKPQTPVLGAKANANDVSAEAMGVILALMPLSSSLLSPFLGLALPRLGLRPTLALGAALMAATGAAFGSLDFVDGAAFVPVAVTLRIVFGLAQSATATPTAAYWNTAFDRFCTVHTVSSTAATVLGMLVPVASALLAARFGDYMSFVVFGAVSMAIVVVCSAMLPADLPLPPPSKAADLGGLIRRVPHVVPALAVLGANMAAAGLIGVLVPFVFAAMDVSDTATSAVFSVSTAAWAGGMFLSSHLLEARGHRPSTLLLPYTGLSVLALAMLALFRTPWPAVGAVALLSFSTSMAQMAAAYLLVDETRQYDPALVAFTSGLKTAGRTGGEAIGNLLGGVLYHRGSLGLTAAVFSGLSLAASAAFALVRGLRRRRSAVPELAEPLLGRNDANLVA